MPETSDERVCVQSICDALRDLVPFVQFKKREKHPWRSVLVKLQAKSYNFTKGNFPHFPQEIIYKAP